ncbi:MAG: 3-hydroxyanthranilate 3,4-dioxygenase [Acidobacteria bacterium]|nr:3-hydroxyanthranilate 3,4-dioxygenase [Acidobacteriota bacterium]
MARLAAFNLKSWIDEHRHLLKPPVGNVLVFKDSNFQVMIVGGPNRRNDFHIDAGEELFYQIEGDIVLKVIEDGKPRDIPIREGDMLLLPPFVPHSPQRPAGTVGMVVERQRLPEEEDRFRWYCEGCGTVLHEAALHVTDLGTQLKPILEGFRNNESLRTCRKCGKVSP